MFGDVSKLFLIRRYEFQSQRLLWLEARKFCARQSGRRLAEARTQEQFQAISAFRRESLTFWLGGFDLVKEGDWRWSSDNSSIDLTRFFNNHEPNGGRIENCLEFLNDGFDDRFCRSALPFLCESGAIGEGPVCSD